MKKPTHGGNIKRLARLSGLPPSEIVDFSANINPLGLPYWVRGLVSAALNSVTHYPDPNSEDLVTAACERYGRPPEEVLCGNGSTELLFLLPRALGKKRAVIPGPSYSDYVTACEAADVEVYSYATSATNNFQLDPDALEAALTGNELVIVANPNNPTGAVLDSAKFRAIAEAHPSTEFIIDEAFGDFVEGFQSLAQDRPSNVTVLLSLTKILAVPGLRLGLALGNPATVASVRRIQPTWPINTLAQLVGARGLRDIAYVERTRAFICEERRVLVDALQETAELEVFPSGANFLLLRLHKPGWDAARLADILLGRGIAIRVCSNFAGLDGSYFRVAVKTAEENVRLIDAFTEILGRPARRRKRRTPAIMFQGCSSNAGKSVLTAALCRILLQDGYRVAPFKAQNMSLNSYVTRDGGEMGRAQVVQAQACRLNPDVRMNPVLLKPNSDTGSQVIVNGKPVGCMEVAEYIRFKGQVFAEIKAAYDSLASSYDVIVLEGAGSPAEVNLKHHDVVNMAMAAYAHAPVLLAGDIDRGGVFASFVGTLECLDERERSMIAGFVINRFRGKADLLDDAIRFTLDRTGVPTLGVVPYVHSLGLPEEDSVSFKCAHNAGAAAADHVEIALIDLPHISNFTDFDSLGMEPDVRLTIVRKPEDLNSPDAVILPGTKNTIGDLLSLETTGIRCKLMDLVGSGATELVGICGGFQMLGKVIADPHGMETSKKTVPGLGLLDIETVLAEEKTLRRFQGRHVESGHELHGYEIHHGVSERFGLTPVVISSQGEHDGAASPDGRIWGAYIHGLFDADDFRRWFIDRLRIRKGLPASDRGQTVYSVEPALNRLADIVRASLDMRAVCRIMRL